MGEVPPHTLTVATEGAMAGKDTGRAPFLFLALECDRPLSLSARYGLADIDSLVIGRGPERRARRTEEGNLRVLRIEIPDARMSSTHARLERALGRWMVMDAGSKNGTFANGEKIERADLIDGDVLDLGRTIFCYREALSAPGATAPVLDANEIRPDAPGLATVLPALEAEFDRLHQIAMTDLSVIISGETGTGKEVIARALHALSRRTGRFVAVNCGAVPDTLIESNLFGHKRGSFSGATQDEVGLVRTAHRGTLLLDEIGDLSPPSQAALLRVLQEDEVLPVGATEPISVDVRVLAATHRDLEDLVDSGGFREDLLARLAGFRFALPSLADRREDMGLLVGNLLRRNSPDRAEATKFTVTAGRALLGYSWPRNIRELEKCLGAATALSRGSDVDTSHLPDELKSARAKPAAKPQPQASATSADPERQRILDALHQCAGNQTKAARLLGISRRTLTNRLNALGIPRPRKGRDA